jgi:hypothetical protein
MAHDVTLVERRRMISATVAFCLELMLNNTHTVYWLERSYSLIYAR